MRYRKGRINQKHKYRFGKWLKWIKQKIYGTDI